MSLLATAAIAACLGTGAFAAVELNTYANKEGYLDVQALTCAQLADLIHPLIFRRRSFATIGTNFD